MTVKTDHGEFTVRDITFAERRELHRAEIRAAKGTEEIDAEAFYELLEHVRELAFEDSEKIFAELNDNEIDAVLVEVYNAYRDGISKKK
ncbi:MAG: hypothetical protein CMB80_12250 [Flammeovirgaceae bacterium]|nr:hypothetical protein [Flammeovirgaceae bacterium]|tara:strand:- start:243 stop:509 length:267 start_codon:yes stop_codon:yes gene_type:complete